MKIAMVGTSLFQHGAEYVMAALARGMVAHGHEVHLILSKWQEDWAKQHPDWVPFAVPPCVKIIVLPQHRARHMFFSLRRVFAKGHYDVVLGHAIPYVWPILVASRLCWNRPRIVNVEHSSRVGVSDDGRILEAPRKNWIGRLLGRLIPEYDAQFAVSSGTADAITRMTGYPRDKIIPVFNPVVDDIFRQKLSQEPDHPWLQQRDIPVIVAGGVFELYKNHRLLFDAFALVLKKRAARLIIFGDGPLEDEYKRHIAELGIGDAVSLPGYTNNLPAAIKRASCYVVSSEIESFSVVCVEALACGTPVVSTNCPYGPPEILKGGKYGILVENHNTQQLADGILRVLDGNGIVPTPEMVAPYTIDATVNRYISALNKICGQ